MTKTRLAAAVAVACCAALSAAHATNGYMSHGYSFTAKAMAGAGEATLANDALAIVGNPASASRIGRRVDIGFEWFRPDRGYDGLTPNAATGAFAPIGGGPDGRGSVDSKNDDFLIPGAGYIHPLDDRSAVGVAMFANGGMNTDFRTRRTLMGLGTFGGNNPLANPPAYQPPDPRAGMQVPGTRAIGNGDAGVNLEQIGLALTYGRDVTDQISLGASFLIGYQTVEVKGIGAFQGFTQTFTESMIQSGTMRGTTPPGLSDNGEDSAWGFGFQVGGIWDVNPMMTLGASFRTKMYMERFDDYADLFADRGDFDIPATLVVGAALKPNNRLTLAFDIQHIMYSDVDAIANTNQLAQRCDLGAAFGQPSAPGATYDARYCLGGSNGAGFGWDDMTVFKFGVQYALTNAFTLRAGYSYAEQPISSREIAFNTLSPAVIEQHWTLGGSYRLRDDFEITGWTMYAPENSVSGPGEFTGGQRPEISMSQFEVGVSFAWLFN